MNTFKFFLLNIVMFSFIGCASAQTNKRSTTEKPKPKPTNSMNDKTPNSQIKILAEGSYGAAETPFIFVARSTETYAQLQKIVENLPPVAEIDFSRAAVIAAFAGTKNTGGYSVAIQNSNGKVTVHVIEPPPGAITTDALTMPFSVAVIAIEEENPLSLEISANWRNAMQTYKVVSGDFESSGGFAGQLKKFKAEGTIGVLSFGDYATLVFNLSGKKADKKLKLMEIASGTVKNGALDLARLNAGSFAEGPKPPLKVSGTMTKDKFIATFEPLPIRIADGFQVSGKIEAVKTK